VNSEALEKLTQIHELSKPWAGENTKWQYHQWQIKTQK
jgi:hypothetical protein